MKLVTKGLGATMHECRSPSWGAWIETLVDGGKIAKKKSLPLVGSVD